MTAQQVKTLCADLGGSRVKLAVVEDGRVAASEMFAVGANTAETLVAVANKGRELMSRTGGAFAGIAVAAPGIVDEGATGSDLIATVNYHSSGRL